MSEDGHNGMEPRAAAPDPEHIDIYLGPYESWNFGDGRRYALPLLRRYWRYITALAELGEGVSFKQGLGDVEQSGWWLPTLWADGVRQGLSFIPFVAANPVGKMPTARQLKKILGTAFREILIQILTASAAELSGASKTIDPWLLKIKYSRFRVGFPIPDKAMHADARGMLPRPAWTRDEGLRGRLGENKRITVIAVIDDGLPFAHRNFRDKTGTRTRVEFCWLQSIAVDPCQKSVLFGREYIRKEIDGLIARHGDDEDALYREAGATADTEDLGSLIDLHATHGAHVMDLATGYAPGRGRPAPDGTTPDEQPREEIRIIAVQLPNTIAWDTSGFGKDMYMLSAFHYIFDRADMLAEGYCEANLRLVVNFSYGFSGGRHDGKTELEAAIDELVSIRRTRTATTTDPLLGPSPTALVLPAGNTFLERLHAQIVDKDFQEHGNVVEIAWRIQPNDRTSSFLELWFWGGFKPSDPLGFAVELRDPGGNVISLQDGDAPPQTSLKVGADHEGKNAPGAGDLERVCAMLNGQQQIIGQLSSDWHRGDTAPQTGHEAGSQRTGRWRVLVAIAPTEPEDPRLPRADAGRWSVVIIRGAEALRDRHKPIHCWIQRSADPESLRSGSRQSYFDEDNYEKTRFTAQGDLSEEDGQDAGRSHELPRPLDAARNGIDEVDVERDLAAAQKALVRRFGSLNGLATGHTALVVGGYRLGAGLGSSLAAARPALYSAAGTPAEEGVELSVWPEKQVNVSSMSDRSRVVQGTIAAGVHSGSLSVVQGTSAAAPFVARQLAETFTAASDASVGDAEKKNYRDLLCGYRPATEGANATNDGAPKSDGKLIAARLGTVRVPPNWQPGIDRSASDK